MAEDFPEIKNKEKNPKHKSLHWEKFSPHAKHDKEKIRTSFALVKFQNIKDQGRGAEERGT